MIIPTRDLTRDWRPADAQRFARFLNAQGEGWPGGGWDPHTPEEAAREIREQSLLGAFVCEVGRKIVSFCSLSARGDERHRAYVPFLTSDPAFHGRGYGKAVLLQAIERAHDLGFGYVYLDTWPGNLKAVPLYKKCGFMWSPESRWGALMENFTPGARSQPIACSFFGKHDWYQTMRRDLSLAPDEHMRGKARVYCYEWEEDGDRLRMTYDRLSWGLLEVETNEFSVGCSLEDEKVVAGMPQRVRWRIENRRPEPLEVVLIASADEGTKLDHKQVLRVARRAELEAEFEIDPEMREKEREPRVPVIRTELLVDGVPLTLAAGFHVRQALQFSLDRGVGLRPDRAEQVVIQCSNELNKPVQASLRVAASRGVQVVLAATNIRLAPKGSAELPMTIRSLELGPITLQVSAQARLRSRNVTPKATDLYAYALGPHDLAGQVEKDRVVLESPNLRISIGRRGGWVSVLDKIRNRNDVAGLHSPVIGPPFPHDEFFELPCEARIEQQPGRVNAVLATPSTYRAGVVLERRITLSNSPLLAVEDTLINGSKMRLFGRCRAFASLRAQGGMVAVPTSKGVVRAPQGSAGRPLFQHRLAEAGEQWPEGWIAAEDREGLAIALLWGQAQRIEAYGNWNQLDRAFPALERGQSHSLAPFYLFAGEGDYFTVQRHWQSLFGVRATREQRRPQTRQPLEFGLAPRPLVLYEPNTNAKLVVDSIGRLELSGRLTLRTPEGLKVRPRAISFKDVSESGSCTERVIVSRRPRLPEGAYPVECALRIDRALYQERQPIIVLGDPESAVAITRTGEGGNLFRIENGALTLTVAPGFQGSAISLERVGREHLRSSYPKARPLAWTNNWLGGIQPQLGALGDQELSKERFTAREIERVGAQGIRWRGVRVSCSPKQERGRQSAMALDYLLAPGSAIFAVGVRTTRRADTAGWADAGFSLWPTLGGSYLDAVLTGQPDARTQRLRCDFGGDVHGGSWTIAENPKTRDAVLLACLPGETSTHGEVLGREGYYLSGNCGAVHEARKTRESVFFVSFTPADRARDLAEALSQLPSLP